MSIAVYWTAQSGSGSNKLASVADKGSNVVYFIFARCVIKDPASLELTFNHNYIPIDIFVIAIPGVCTVCGGVSSGKHYGVESCRSCNVSKKYIQTSQHF